MRWTAKAFTSSFSLVDPNVPKASKTGGIKTIPDRPREALNMRYPAELYIRAARLLRTFAGEKVGVKPVEEKI
jgi:hypothetical protein